MNRISGLWSDVHVKTYVLYYFFSSNFTVILMWSRRKGLTHWNHQFDESLHHSVYKFYAWSLAGSGPPCDATVVAKASIGWFQIHRVSPLLWSPRPLGPARELPETPNQSMEPMRRANHRQHPTLGATCATWAYPVMSGRYPLANANQLSDFIWYLCHNYILCHGKCIMHCFHFCVIPREHRTCLVNDGTNNSFSDHWWLTCWRTQNPIIVSRHLFIGSIKKSVQNLSPMCFAFVDKIQLKWVCRCLLTYTSSFSCCLNVCDMLWIRSRKWYQCTLVNYEWTHLAYWLQLGRLRLELSCCSIEQGCRACHKKHVHFVDNELCETQTFIFINSYMRMLRDADHVIWLENSLDRGIGFYVQIGRNLLELQKVTQNATVKKNGTKH